MRKLLLAGCFVALGGAAFAPSARADLQPGNYEMTTTVTVPGMPQPQTASQTQCMKPDEAKDPAGHLLSEMSQDGNCKLGNHQQDGNHLVADFACTMQGQKTEGHLDMTFAETTMDGTITMKIDMGAQGTQSVTTTIKAVRKGDCS